jgi:hypothetical protein
VDGVPAAEVVRITSVGISIGKSSGVVAPPCWAPPLLYCREDPPQRRGDSVPDRAELTLTARGQRDWPSVAGLGPPSGRLRPTVTKPITISRFGLARDFSLSFGRLKKGLVEIPLVPGPPRPVRVTPSKEPPAVASLPRRVYTFDLSGIF